VLSHFRGRWRALLRSQAIGRAARRRTRLLRAEPLRTTMAVLSRRAGVPDTVVAVSWILAFPLRCKTGAAGVQQ
jgi:hypothetical protein